MSLLVVAQVLLSLTFLVSGLAKLPDPRATEDALRSLRVPLRAAHPVAARAVPIAEVAGALLIWGPWLPSQIVLASAQLLLAITYLVLIGRALRFPEPVTCSCFGRLGSPTISRSTLLRNALLVLLAVLALVAAATGQLAAAVTAAPLVLLAIVVGVLLAIGLTVLTVRGTEMPSAESTQAGGSAPASSHAGNPSSDTVAPNDEAENGSEDEILDYERSPTPFGALQGRDGSLLTLAEATDVRAALLVFVRPGCGPCERVLDRVSGWQGALGEVIDVRVVLPRPLDTVPTETLDRAGSGAAYDVEQNVGEALGVHGTPAAVLLGADQLLAGGPVSGASEVQDFVEEIIAQVGSTH